jgi:hypothetical protein
MNGHFAAAAALKIFQKETPGLEPGVLFLMLVKRTALFEAI